MINYIRRYELTYKTPPGHTGGIMFKSADFEALGGKRVSALCVDKVEDSVYITDEESHAIFKVSGLDGSISVYAGLPGTAGNNAGNVVDKFDARFNTPTGIFCDNTGNIYIADSGNNQIRVIGPQGKVGLFAGRPSCSHGFDLYGVPTDCRLRHPEDVCVDNAGRVYIADTRNHAIRVVQGGMLYTMAGNGTPGDVIGPTSAARFNRPQSVAANRRGDVIVADTNNLKVKLIKNSNVYTLFGTGVYGDTLSAGECHRLSYSDVDARGNYYVLDIDDMYSTTNVTRVLKIGDDGVAGIAVDLGDVEDTVSGFAINASSEIFVAFSEYTIASSSTSSGGSSESSSTVKSSQSSKSTTGGSSESTQSSGSTSSSSSSSSSSESSSSSKSSSSESSLSSSSSSETHSTSDSERQ